MSKLAGSQVAARLAVIKLTDDAASAVVGPLGEAVLLDVVGLSARMGRVSCFLKPHRLEVCHLRAPALV